MSSRAAKAARDLLLIALLLTCTRAMPNNSPAPAQPYNGPAVVLPDGYTVRLEVAADDTTRAQGLMFRDRVPEGTGMLFMFPRSGEFAFWMKNTIVKLDMIWIDDKGTVVHVEPNVPPCKSDPCPSYPPHAKASYVLELGAGEAAKHRVVNGATLRLQRLDNIAVR